MASYCRDLVLESLQSLQNLVGHTALSRLGRWTPLCIVPPALLALYKLGGCKFLNLFVKTVRRDVRWVTTCYQCNLRHKANASWTLYRIFYRYGKILYWTRVFQRKNLNVPLVFEQLVKKHPDKACFIFEDQVWTFKQVSTTFMVNK